MPVAGGVGTSAQQPGLGQSSGSPWQGGYSGPNISGSGLGQAGGGQWGAGSWQQPSQQGGQSSGSPYGFSFSYGNQTVNGQPTGSWQSPVSFFGNQGGQGGQGGQGFDWGGFLNNLRSSFGQGNYSQGGNSDRQAMNSSPPPVTMNGGIGAQSPGSPQGPGPQGAAAPGTTYAGGYNGAGGSGGFRAGAAARPTTANAPGLQPSSPQSPPAQSGTSGLPWSQGLVGGNPGGMFSPTSPPSSAGSPQFQSSPPPAQPGVSSLAPSLQQSAANNQVNNNLAQANQNQLQSVESALGSNASGFESLPAYAQQVIGNAYTSQQDHLPGYGIGSPGYLGGGAAFNPGGPLQGLRGPQAQAAIQALAGLGLE